MTIKELAKLAGVSISTVSKVMNHKDDNIRAETQERILQLARQYNYSPYAKSYDTRNRSGIIGVLLTDATSSTSVAPSISLAARSSGYSVLFQPYDLVSDSQLISSPYTEGVIFEEVPETDILSALEKDMPAVGISVNHSLKHDCISISYTEAGYVSAKALVEAHHHHILCITDDNGVNSRAFLQGFKQCLFDNQIPYDATMHYIWPEKSADLSFITYNFTAAACINSSVSVTLLHSLQTFNLKIPRDFSVICLKRDNEVLNTSPMLTYINLPFSALGKAACESLINKISGRSEPLVHLKYEVCQGESIDVPPAMRNKKIIVVGSINMDIMLNVDRLADSGETIMVQKRVQMPGGKGLNQVIMSARLGADTHLIGKIGKDYDGFSLYNFMNANKLNMEGILTDDNLETGKAYITVQNNGESSILVFSGANANLSEENISRHEELFEDASFCLLNSELPFGITEYAAKLAKKHNVKTILKPCDVNELSDSLLKNIDILMPNRKEAQLLLPNLKTEEERADYFIKKGVKTVIITLGHKGGYIKDSEHSAYFPAAPFEPIDTTGAADAFAATLAVYLSRNYQIDAAIHYATYAAGFCITRQGVSAGLVDQNTLEFYADKELENNNFR